MNRTTFSFCDCLACKLVWWHSNTSVPVRQPIKFIPIYVSRILPGLYHCCFAPHCWLHHVIMPQLLCMIHNNNISVKATVVYFKKLIICICQITFSILSVPISFHLWLAIMWHELDNTGYHRRVQVANILNVFSCRFSLARGAVMI